MAVIASHTTLLFSIQSPVLCHLSTIDVPPVTQTPSASVRNGQEWPRASLFSICSLGLLATVFSQLTPRRQTPIACSARTVFSTVSGKAGRLT